MVWTPYDDHTSLRAGDERVRHKSGQARSTRSRVYQASKPHVTSLANITSGVGVPQAYPPTTSFDEYLPNLTDLPELQAVMDRTSVTVTFQNPQAVFSYVATDAFRMYGCNRMIWGALPIHSVRRLIVDVRNPCEDAGDEWFVKILRALPNLEHIEFGGNFLAVVQRLCREVVQGGLHDPIQT